MSKEKSNRYNEKLKVTSMIILLSISTLLTYFFNVIFKTQTIFSHFFYIPIFLACLWWKKKGIIVPLFLIVLLIFFPIIYPLDESNEVTIDIFLRALLFVVTGVVVAFLSQNISKVEDNLKESDHNLKERVRELKCLYKISKIVEKPAISLESIIEKTLELIPQGCQYPKLICVRICFDGKEYKTENYKETEWRISTNILINEKEMKIEVFYLEENQFIEEEKFLIKDVANRLNFVFKRKEFEELITEENKRLLDLSKIRKEIITRVSHELKTPLNSIYSVSQFLLSNYKADMSDEIVKYVGIINKGGDRLRKFVTNLIDVSIMESGKLELKLHNENLVKIVNECVYEMMFLASKRNIFLNVDLPEELYFEVDKLRIEQVITNLLSNAIKNTPPNGFVNISILKNKEFIEICITDTGIGFIKKEMEHLFTKFGKIERYGKSLPIDIEGTGLGLYISKEIVQLLGGQILVESKGRNKGSTFTVRLFYNRKF